jgi:hypothetical protein
MSGVLRNNLNRDFSPKTPVLLHLKHPCTDRPRFLTLPTPYLDRKFLCSVVTILISQGYVSSMNRCLIFTDHPEHVWIDDLIGCPSAGTGIREDNYIMPVLAIFTQSDPQKHALLLLFLHQIPYSHISIL